MQLVDSTVTEFTRTMRYIRLLPNLIIALNNLLHPCLTVEIGNPFAKAGINIHPFLRIIV